MVYFTLTRITFFRLDYSDQLTEFSGRVAHYREKEREQHTYEKHRPI